MILCTYLLYTSNACLWLTCCLKRREFSFYNLVMRQIASTQQPKQRQSRDEAFQICLQERNQQGGVRQLTHTRRLACFFFSLVFYVFRLESLWFGNWRNYMTELRHNGGSDTSCFYLADSHCFRYSKWWFSFFLSQLRWMLYNLVQSQFHWDIV